MKSINPLLQKEGSDGHDVDYEERREGMLCARTRLRTHANGLFVPSTRALLVSVMSMCHVLILYFVCVRRFAFYDQIHTTGMDIKHIVNAVAVITLGKDMVFRDYVQVM